MKYSGIGRVISCQTGSCSSENGLLSLEKRNDMKESKLMTSELGEYLENMAEASAVDCTRKSKEEKLRKCHLLFGIRGETL